MTAPPPPIVDANGRSIALEQQLASGGEGRVFTLPHNTSLVAKVYHSPPTPQTVEKLTTMVQLANPQLVKLATWPTGLLYHARTRHLAGFVMPRLSECQPIQQLYNPVQRLRFFPRAAWNFQVRAAINLAAAFDEVHKTGCLVGDVNQSNVQVSTQALIRLIDCDSFQVRVNGKAFLCEVGVAHYLPPELQGKSLRGLVRTENHDRFGLAVLIYQLLFVGRHPYAGVYRGTGDPSYERLIADFKFAQGPAAHTWNMSPPPHTPTLEDIPPDVGTLFRRAFERGSETGTRPRPAEWHATLQRLEQSIVECPADSGHKYWRGARSCVWCRLANRGGPEYYFAVAGRLDAFTVDEAKLQDVLRRLAAAQEVDFSYSRDSYRAATPTQPKPLPPHIVDLWNIAADKTRKLIEGKQAQAIRAKTEEEGAQRKLKQFKNTLARDLAHRQRDLEAELAIALDYVAIERRDRKKVGRALMAATALGLAIALLHTYSWAFAATGGLVTVLFGTWLAIYYYLALHSPGEKEVAQVRRMIRLVQAETNQRWLSAKDQSRQESEKASKARAIALQGLNNEMHTAAESYHLELSKELARRRQALEAAEQSVAAHEFEWRRLESGHSHERNRIAPTIHRLADECRSLASQYQAEVQRLTARSEEAARVRHMRLHLIADADIPQFGAGRKQLLASKGIFTAADIEIYRIRGIKGIRNVLAGNLLAWKEGVLRQFRFDPATALSAADQRAITLKFRHAQQQTLDEMRRHAAELDSLAPAYKVALQKLIPQIKSAVGQYEQAKADLHLLNGSR